MRKQKKGKEQTEEKQDEDKEESTTESVTDNPDVAVTLEETNK